MADKRKRIYYTKAQVTNGLITKGKEWMFKDTTEYIGQYHTYTTGEVFSETTFVNTKSRILIPYLDLKKLNQQTDVGLDLVKNFEYDNIKTLDVKKSITPNPSIISPADSDIKRGWMERYFAQKVNDDSFLELSKKDFGKVGTTNGLDSILWEKFKIRWKITGPTSDIKNPNGGIKESGIEDTNRRSTLIASDKYPSLKTYITNYREFAQP
jgi:hypothetical protein